MQHKNYMNYSEAELFDALESVDDVAYPGERARIEKRIDELSGVADQEGSSGFGGWLILVGLGVVIAPFRLGYSLSGVYSDVFESGAWQALTTPSLETYNALFAPLIIAESIINFMIVVASIYLIFLFFSAKKNFPKWYIGIVSFSLAFIILDALVVKVVFPGVDLFDPESIKEYARVLITFLVWVPYMLMSKRVKATFVKD